MLNSLFKIVYLIGLVVAITIRTLYTAPYKREPVGFREKAPLDMVLVSLAGVAMLIPIVYVLTSWLDFADFSLPDWVGWVGTLLFAGFCLLLWRSHADLGRNWTVSIELREEHVLVTDGVYRHIRHPMYAAHLLWAVAQVLMLHNWIAGPALLATFLPQYLYRVPREEKMMVEQFGAEYESYMNRTGRMWPRLRVS